MSESLELFEDRVRKEKMEVKKENRYSKYCESFKYDFYKWNRCNCFT